MRRLLIILAVISSVGLALAAQCKYCGQQTKDAKSLVGQKCAHHPNGFGKGKHVAYEGSVKSEYTCKYCGRTGKTIKSLINSGKCSRHPDGFGKGYHFPAR